jgi:hypothetical protein
MATRANERIYRRLIISAGINPIPDSAVQMASGQRKGCGSEKMILASNETLIE